MDILNSSPPFDLGSTKSYYAREAVWFGRDANGYGGVIIRLWDEKRRERGTNSGRHGYESDLYEVKEESPPVGVLARAFEFINKLDGKQKFVYRVLVGRNHSCTCDAGRARVPGSAAGQTGCKHRDSVIAALESGFWDGTDDDAGEGRDIDATGEPTQFEMEAAV